ncbi:MAG TPA: 2'-5' RNA ligase family protein [Usitatibacter sp.]|nr:2'-5' RNA ligase family protein [Usitatibacter sp.]
MGRLKRPPRPPLPRFAVAWFPAFDGIERIEAFRGRHDPAAPLIPAHLSLVFPFATALTRLQVETHVRRIVSPFPPIALGFRGVRLEANEFVFLMAQRGRAAVIELHDRLYSRSLRHHLRPDLPYSPHITLARQPAFDALERTFEEAQEAFGGEFHDVMREVTLLAVARDGRIERLETFPLNSA